MKYISQNRRARFDYEILKTFIAGMSLVGSEVKSLRDHRVSLKGSFISLQQNEAWWKGGTIQPWEHSSKNHEERRERKLLLNKKELKELKKHTDERGNTIVPLGIGFIRGKAKIEIALAKGKKQYDKRESIKKRDIERRDLQGVVRTR